MMQTIFEEISFRSDEKMSKEPAEVFTELNDVKDFHFECGV